MKYKRLVFKVLRSTRFGTRFATRLPGKPRLLTTFEHEDSNRYSIIRGFPWLGAVQRRRLESVVPSSLFASICGSSLSLILVAATLRQVHSRASAVFSNSYDTFPLSASPRLRFSLSLFWLRRPRGRMHDISVEIIQIHSRIYHDTLPVNATRAFTEEKEGGIGDLLRENPPFSKVSFSA